MEKIAGHFRLRRNDLKNNSRKFFINENSIQQQFLENFCSEYQYGFSDEVDITSINETHSNDPKRHDHYCRHTFTTIIPEDVDVK